MIEKGIPCKWKPTESMGSYTYIRENRIEAKNCNRDEERQYVIIKGSMHGEYNYCKYLGVQNWSTKYITQILQC